eukprot:scaffold17876_cov132-Isochrysis_galbana.AAC.2
MRQPSTEASIVRISPCAVSSVLRAGRETESPPSAASWARSAARRASLTEVVRSSSGAYVHGGMYPSSSGKPNDVMQPFLSQNCSRPDLLPSAPLAITPSSPGRGASEPVIAAMPGMPLRVKVGTAVSARAFRDPPAAKAAAPSSAARLPHSWGPAPGRSETRFTRIQTIFKPARTSARPRLRGPTTDHDK